MQEGQEKVAYRAKAEMGVQPRVRNPRQWLSDFSGHKNLLGNFFRIRFLGPSLHQKSLNVLGHLYFDKAQTADLGPLENLERLRNPPCLSAVPNKSHPVHYTRLCRSEMGEKRITSLHA